MRRWGTHVALAFVATSGRPPFLPARGAVVVLRGVPPARVRARLCGAQRGEGTQSIVATDRLFPPRLRRYRDVCLEHKKKPKAEGQVYEKVATRAMRPCAFVYLVEGNHTRYRPGASGHGLD